MFVSFACTTIHRMIEWRAHTHTHTHHIQAPNACNIYLVRTLQPDSVKHQTVLLQCARHAMLNNYLPYLICEMTCQYYFQIKLYFQTEIGEDNEPIENDAESFFFHVGMELRCEWSTSDGCEIIRLQYDHSYEQNESYFHSEITWGNAKIILFWFH